MNAIPRYHDFAVRDDPTNLPKTAPRPARPGILHRVFDAIRQWRQRQVDREIARFLGGGSGGISPTRTSEDWSSISRAIAAFGHDLAAGGVAQPKRASGFKLVNTLSINERGAAWIGSLE